MHGDLKPENVLLYQPPRSDLYIAKLIDFDDAYPVGKPPLRDVIGGNPLYGAPEWLRYLRGDKAVRARHLTQAVDMFAFGLLVHTYLTGSLPTYSGNPRPLRSWPAKSSLWTVGWTRCGPIWSPP